MSIGIVVYTDGSARPNPGYSGLGCHGYIYNTELEPNTTRVIKNWYVTNTGYKQELSDTDTEVKVIKYLDMCFAIGLATSNCAEVSSVNCVLNYIISTYMLSNNSDNIKIDNIDIFTDSEYVNRGINEWMDTWKKTNWKKNNNDDISNKDIWVELSRLLDTLKRHNCDFNISWTKGHDAHLGNERADKLAVIGAIHATYKDSFNYITTSEPDIYWKYETAKQHPLLKFKRIFFSLNNNDDNHKTYFLAHTTDSSNKDFDTSLGKRDSTTAYAVVNLIDDDPYLSVIKERLIDISNGLSAVYRIKNDILHTKEVTEWIDNYQKYSLYAPKSSSFDLNVVGDKNILKEINPPYLIYRSLEALYHMKDIFYNYLNSDLKSTDVLQYKVIDITDKFYTSGKGGVSISKDIKIGMNSLEVKVSVEHMGVDRVFNINIILGKDLPVRNDLKQLETHSPKICLILEFNNLEPAKYYGFVSSNIGCGLFSGYYSNIIL